MRNYKRKVGSKKKRYGDYSKNNLDNALRALQEGMAVRDAEKTFNIPKSTLRQYFLFKEMKPIGCPASLSEQEETAFVKHLIVVAEWGFPFSNLDLRLMVKGYLDQNNKRIKQFKDNIPGEDWGRSFLKRHSKDLSRRLCQNIKTSRADQSKEVFEKYFENLGEVLKDIPPSNILNSDETNLSDDPGQEKLIFKRGKKYPERIQNYTKGNISIMYAGTAAREMLLSLCCCIQVNPFMEHLDSRWTKRHTV